jgi:hypothetical protein
VKLLEQETMGFRNRLTQKARGACAKDWRWRMFRIALSAVSIALFLLPAQAQVRYRNERAWQIEETTRTINDCEKRTNAFKGTLRHAINESRLDHSHREEQLNRDADRLEDAIDHVGDSWNRDHDPGKTRRFVAEAIRVSRDINNTMIKWHLNPEAEREWDAVRAELNRLAAAFGLRPIRW